MDGGNGPPFVGRWIVVGPKKAAAFVQQPVFDWATRGRGPTSSLLIGKKRIVAETKLRVDGKKLIFGGKKLRIDGKKLILGGKKLLLDEKKLILGGKKLRIDEKVHTR